MMLTTVSLKANSLWIYWCQFCVREFLSEAAAEIHAERCQDENSAQLKSNEVLGDSYAIEHNRIVDATYQETIRNLMGKEQRVRELHIYVPDVNEAEGFCRSCHQEYPCATIQALDGTVVTKECGCKPTCNCDFLMYLDGRVGCSGCECSNKGETK